MRHSTPALALALLLPLLSDGLVPFALVTARSHRRRTSYRSPAVLQGTTSAVETCRLWVTDHVIKLNLCPYAQPAAAKGAIRYSPQGAVDEIDIVDAVFSESALLLDGDAEAEVRVGKSCQSSCQSDHSQLIPAAGRRGGDNIDLDF